jgi:hypothetical protein
LGLGGVAFTTSTPQIYASIFNFQAHRQKKLPESAETQQRRGFQGQKNFENNLGGL